jgi:hypothetical protein
MTEPLSPSAGTRSLVTQAPQAAAAQPRIRRTLSLSGVPLLGAASALAAANPVFQVARGPVGWLVLLVVMAAAVWASPIVAQRPTSSAVRLLTQLVRHRNTAFAVGCVVLAALTDPPVWLAVVDTALLIGYLLAVDAFAAGPIGADQARGGTVPLTAAAASAIVLVAAEVPVDSGAVWGRVVAALAVAAAATAAGAALWLRRSGSRQDESLQQQLARFRDRRNTSKPRHL